MTVKIQNKLLGIFKIENKTENTIMPPCTFIVQPWFWYCAISDAFISERGILKLENVQRRQKRDEVTEFL